MSLRLRLPEVRGKLSYDAVLAPYSWLRVGGPADVLFLPADEADLALFLSALPRDIPVTVLGVASNTLIRDGGIRGVTIKLGPAFAKIQTQGQDIHVGTGALDSRLAKAAANAGLAGLEFYAGIPGTIGGALRMNAGCYGTETADVLKQVVAIDRRGRRQIMSVAELDYAYRTSGASPDLIYTQATFTGTPDKPEDIKARMQTITTRREDSQPIREKTGGSTFKNPNPESSNGRSAWQLIDAVGGRGLKVGGASMSEKHCNFMINQGDATAADLEALGEEIRRRVWKQEQVVLEWEVRRVGEPLSTQTYDAQNLSEQTADTQKGRV